jgi:hypothetical protein
VRRAAEQWIAARRRPRLTPSRGAVVRDGRSRRKNNGVRKVCGCSADRQRKCSPSVPLKFHLAGQRRSGSIDEEVGYHVELGGAMPRRSPIASATRSGAGTFVRHGNRGQRVTAPVPVLTLRGFAERYLQECSSRTGKSAPRQTRKHSDDYHRFTTLCAFRLAGWPAVGDLPCLPRSTNPLYEQFIAARRAQDYKRHPRHQGRS